MTVTDQLACTIREADGQDPGELGRIFYDAFESIATRHNFPVEPPSREFTQWKVASMLETPGVAAFVAERDGVALGSAFVDERDVVAGVGPVTIEPSAQDDGIGRALMEAVLARETARAACSIRLVQTAYHYRSLALYTKLGFVTREPLSVMQGTPPAFSVPGCGARRAREDDLASCNALCLSVHGHTREHELADAIAAGTAQVVERRDHISGYATGFGYGWHAVAETNEDLIALLSAAEAFIGLGILVPTRNGQLMRWCLDQGMRIVQQSTLMTIGLYSEPAGAYLPSIVY